MDDKLNAKTNQTKAVANIDCVICEGKGYHDNGQDPQAIYTGTAGRIKCHCLPENTEQPKNALLVGSNDLLAVDYDRAHNWLEDFHHENGKYEDQCSQCNVLFIGHERRSHCKICAFNILEKNNDTLMRFINEEMKMSAGDPRVARLTKLLLV